MAFSDSGRERCEDRRSRPKWAQSASRARTPFAIATRAEVLKSWLVRLYPAGIRAADEKKSFQKFSGTLKLEPAGSNDQFRFALLRGKVLLAKGGDTESAFEGQLEVVLTYRLDAAQVQSVRGVVQGTYLYRTRATSRQKLRVAIESRPQ